MGTCKYCGRAANIPVLSGGFGCRYCYRQGKFETIYDTRIKFKETDISNWNMIISPKTLEKFVGQEKIKSELRTIIAANKIHKIQIPHLLFSSSMGLGKTTLANIFASMITNDYVLTNALDLNSSVIPSNKVIIIDEIHMMKKTERLLTLMDRGSQIIIGCTTMAGKLSAPFLSRFTSLVLEPYSITELTSILLTLATKIKINLPENVAIEVAKRSKQTARIALFLFRRIYDRYVITNGWDIKKWFSELGIDDIGLDVVDRHYLGVLSKDKPLGLQYISAATGIDSITILEIIEPFLIRQGFVIRTEHGRLLSR